MVISMSITDNPERLMPDPKSGPTEDDVRTRGQLLPEEKVAGGSEKPEEQARAILEDSEERVDAPHDPPDGELPGGTG
jgi:hypothetical protein